jgi:hypothetical protein
MDFKAGEVEVAKPAGGVSFGGKPRPAVGVSLPGAAAPEVQSSPVNKSREV